MRHSHLTTTIGTAALFLTFTTPAWATTSAWVGFEPQRCSQTSCQLPDATFVATGGQENNAMTVHADFTGVTVSDPAGVDAGNSCSVVNLTTVRCSIFASKLSLRLSGGGGDDSIDATSERAVDPEFDGGDGNDSLFGTEDTDILRGGTGNDRLFARGSPRGPDVLDGGPGSDTLDGGSGEDEVRYPTAAAPVDVDLQRGTGNGQPGENDTTVRIDDVTTVPAGSTLAGDDGPNRLDLRTGSGTLTGRGGDDVLTRGRNASGGDGSDIFYDVSGAVACDGGSDEVNGAVPRIALSCEEVYDPRFEMISLRDLRRLTGTFASTEVSCDPLQVAPGSKRRGCPASLTATAGGRRIAGSKTTLKRGRSKKLTAKLDKRAQRSLKARGTLDVRLSYSLRTPGTKAERGSFVTTLRRP